MAGGLVSPQLGRARLLVLLFSLCLDTPSPLEASHVRESSSMAGGLEVSGRAREPTQSGAIPDHKASLVHGPRLIPRGRGLCSWATGEIRRQRVGSSSIGCKIERDARFLFLEREGMWKRARAFCCSEGREGGGQQGGAGTLKWVIPLSVLQGHFLSCWSPRTFLD